MKYGRSDADRRQFDAMIPSVAASRAARGVKIRSDRPRKPYEGRSPLEQRVGVPVDSRGAILFLVEATAVIGMEATACPPPLGPRRCLAMAPRELTARVFTPDRIARLGALENIAVGGLCSVMMFETLPEGGRPAGHQLVLTVGATPDPRAETFIVDLAIEIADAIGAAVVGTYGPAADLRSHPEVVTAKKRRARAHAMIFTGIGLFIVAMLVGCYFAFGRR